MGEEVDAKALKREVVSYVKGITSDLMQGKPVQEPDQVNDKVLYAAFLNLRNCVADTMDECSNLKHKTKELRGKIDDMERTLNHMENENYHQVEVIEKLRDNIDLKESNQRIMEHELKQFKIMLKEVQSKNTASLKEYDDVANELKSQIELVDKQNVELNAEVNRVQAEAVKDRREIAVEKEDLYQAQILHQKNCRTYEKKVSKLKAEVQEVEETRRDVEKMRSQQEDDLKDLQRKLEQFSADRKMFEEEEVRLKKAKDDIGQEKEELEGERAEIIVVLSDIEKQKSELKTEKLDLEKEKVALKKTKTDIEEEKAALEAKTVELHGEKEELFRVQHIFQEEMENFERALGKHSRDKADLQEAQELFNYERTEASYERIELRKAKEKLQNEQEHFKVAIEGYQANLTHLVQQLYDGKHTEEKMKKTTDKLTNHLLKSLEKVEKLQGKLEARINAMKVSTPVPPVIPVTLATPVPLKSPSASGPPPDPIDDAIPVISTIPLPLNTQTRLPSNTKADRSSVNGTMLYNELAEPTIPNSPSPMNDTTQHVASQMNNRTRHVAFEHGIQATSSPLVPPKGTSDDHQFCNMRDHALLKENINKLQNVLQQHKSEATTRETTRRSDERRRDMKWELCRLEAKVGDAVLKRSLALLSDMHGSRI